MFLCGQPVAQLYGTHPHCLCELPKSTSTRPPPKPNHHQRGYRTKEQPLDKRLDGWNYYISSYLEVLRYSSHRSFRDIEFLKSYCPLSNLSQFLFFTLPQCLKSGNRETRGQQFGEKLPEVHCTSFTSLSTTDLHIKMHCKRLTNHCPDTLPRSCVLICVVSTVLTKALMLNH